jgi:AcrR family transcriptional regulator
VSPRSDQQNQIIREATRERILRAGLRCFARHGYDGTPVRRIAEEAGVAQGLLYRHFDGKEGLLRAIFERSMRDVRVSFALAEAAPPGQRVEALLAAAARLIRENTDFWRLSYAVRMVPSVVEGLGSGLRDWLDEVRVTLERYVRDAGLPDAAVEAAILFALIDGVCQHYVIDAERYPLDAVMRALAARYRGPAACARMETEVGR